MTDVTADRSGMV